MDTQLHVVQISSKYILQKFKTKFIVNSWYSIIYVFFYTQKFKNSPFSTIIYIFSDLFISSPKTKSPDPIFIVSSTNGYCLNYWYSMDYVIENVSKRTVKTPFLCIIYPISSFNFISCAPRIYNKTLNFWTFDIEIAENQ